MRKLILAVIKKEFLHIQKDPQALFIVLIWPVIMLIFFGYAITMEMRNVDLIIADYANSTHSRNIIQKFRANNFFKVSQKTINQSDVDQIFQTRQAKSILIIPANFNKNLNRNSLAQLQLIIDASDPNSALTIQNYLNTMLTNYNFEINPNLKLPINLQVRYFYNPELKSSFFFVPGLTTIIMLFISTLLTSIALVKEKERGSMEQILVSPIKSSEIIIGKVIPYVCVAFLSGIMVILVAIFWFGVPMRGSFILAALMMLLYIFTGSSLGLLISSIAKTQQVALLISLMGTFLPTMLLSGFMFPLESMPKIFQYISNVVPATHFIQIIRGIMLKGVGVVELADHITILCLISFVLTMVSIKKLKTSLE